MAKKSQALPPGMGAILQKKGVAFRVWAPNAQQVAVVGEFNEWNPMAHLLTQEGNGYWAGLVPTAKVGQEYRYLLKNGEQALSRIDPYARQVTNSVGNGVIYQNGYDWGEDSFRLPPWNEMVIYEMHIGTFALPDAEGGSPGTFNEATAQLPYLQALGINVIELMPPMEFAGGISWGYNPAAIFAVESDYGGPDALKDFVKSAHAHGIGVIMDVVYNHLGPSDLDLWRFDGWYENDLGGIYFYNDERASTAWGHTRPDYGRAEVRQYLRDNALMWIDEYHLDGLRWDSTVNIRNRNGNGNDPAHDLPEGWALMQWINEELQKSYPGALTIAEDLQQNPWITKSTGEGGAGFGAQWDSKFVHTIRAALISNDDDFRDLQAVADAIIHRYNDDFTDRVIYTESHDEVANGKARLPEEITPGEADSYFAKKRAAIGAALVFTAPGIPMIFQGQEFLADRWFEDTAPLPWERRDRFQGIVQLYSDLIKLRRNREGKSRGLCGQRTNIYHIDQERKILAYIRWEGDDPAQGVVVIINFRNVAQAGYGVALPAAGDWQVLFNSDAKHYDETFGDYGSTVVTQPTNNGEASQVDLAPYGVLILART